EELGLLGAEASARVRAKAVSIEDELARLAGAVVPAHPEVNDALAALATSPLTESVRALELLRRPEVPYEALLRFAGLTPVLEVDAAAELETQVKYEGY